MRKRERDKCDRLIEEADKKLKSYCGVLRRVLKEEINV